MKMVFKVFNFIIIMTLVSCRKDSEDDENNPYEFGFTIDGQQHRHEKKGVNGIIEGEFGFITADGIYHVTVYATDENGNFRILSMRNVRISAPLDGSPLPPGQKIDQTNPTHDGGGKITNPHLNSDGHQDEVNRQNQATTKSSGAPFLFTTQPTIKPACGGCGYVTTSKPKPGQPFPFQTPAFQGNGPNGPGAEQVQKISSSPNNRIDASGNNFGADQSNGANLNSNSPSKVDFSPTSPQIPTNSQNENKQGLHQGPQQIYEANIPSDAPSSYPTNSQNENNPVHQGPNYSGPQHVFEANVPSDAPLLNSQNANNQGPNYPNTQEIYKTNVPSYPTNNQNENDQRPEGPNYYNSPQVSQNNPLSQVSVTNGAIHVPGHADIPIKDKYPGMVNGLPNGIKESDVSDLLYKFNYTVGFHGHYEKGLKNGAKIGGYFVNGRDGLSRVVTYIADENGFRPKFKFIRLDLTSDDVPKEGSEKLFGLKNFEFVWYPI